MSRDWDAVTYDQLPLPHQEWGKGVLGKLELNGDEAVLDAGCGIGRDVEMLLERLPNGRVIAVDGSAQMLSAARNRINDKTGRVAWLLADLSSPLPIAVPVDACVSVATFHWIKNHEGLFANLATVMRPGAQFVFDAGGKGNIPNVMDAIRRAAPEVYEKVDAQSWMWEFADGETTAARLDKAGFDVTEAILRPHPIRVDDPNVLRRFLKAAILGGYLDQMIPEKRDDFVEKVADAMTEPVVDYVRLEVVARRR